MHFFDSLLPKAWAGYSSDILLLIVFFIIFIAYGLLKGKKKLNSLIVSFYPAAFIFLELPAAWLSKLAFFGSTTTAVYLSKLVVFLVIFLFIHIFVITSVTSDYNYAASNSVLEVSLLSLLCLALVIIFITHVIPLGGVYPMNLPLFTYFQSQTAFFIWLLIPFAALYFL